MNSIIRTFLLLLALSQQVQSNDQLLSQLCIDLLSKNSAKDYSPKILREVSEPFDLFLKISEQSKNYAHKIKQLQEVSEAKFSDFTAVESAIYPLAGRDVALPFLLFPNLRRLTAISRMRFLFPPQIDPEKDPFHYKRDTLNSKASHLSFDYAGIAEVSNLSHKGHYGALPNIVGILTQALPDFELKSIKTFYTNEVIPETVRTVSHPYQASHGVIQFTHSGSQEICEILFLDIDIGKSNYRNLESVKTSWWYKIVAESKPKALIAKAAMGIFTPDHQGNFIPHFQEALNQVLTQNLGFIIENATSVEGTMKDKHGVSIEEPGWEFFGLRKFSEDDELILPKLRLGYNDGVRVVRLKN